MRWWRALVVDLVVVAVLAGVAAVASPPANPSAVLASSYLPNWYQVTDGASFAPTGTGQRYLAGRLAASSAGDWSVFVHQTVPGACVTSQVCRQAPAVVGPGSSTPVDLAMPTFSEYGAALEAVDVTEVAMNGAGDRIAAAVRVTWDVPDVGVHRDYVLTWTRTGSTWSAHTQVAMTPNPGEYYVHLQLTDDGSSLVFSYGQDSGNPPARKVFKSVNGGAPSEVISDPGLGDAAMSANGRWLVYAKREPAPNNALFEIRGRVLDGSSDPDRVIVPGTTTNPSNLVVSGKGRYVGFVSDQPNGTAAPAGSNHVFSWDRDWDNGGDPNKTFDEADTGNRVQWAQKLDDDSLFDNNHMPSGVRSLTRLVMSADGSVLARAAYDRPSGTYCGGDNLVGSSNTPSLVLWSQDQQSGSPFAGSAVTSAECALELTVSSTGDVVNWLRAPTLNGGDTAVQLETFGPTPDAASNREAHLGDDPNVVDGGDPVSLTTGNFHHTETDLASPAGVYGMDLSRTYNALATGSGDVGGRWSNSFSQRINTTGSGSANRQLSLPDGRKVTFTPNGASWASPRTFDGTLTIPAPGEPTVVLPGGETWTFWRLDDPNPALRGFVKSMTDGRGQTVTIARGDTGVLQSVTSNRGPATGRNWQLVFTDSDGDGLADQVQATTTGTAPTQIRTIKYMYQSPGSGATWAKTLASASAPYYAVTDPHRVTSYTVDPDSGRVTDVVIGGVNYTTPPPAVTEVHNTYQADGRVRRQVLDNGDVVTYTWQNDTRRVIVANTASGDINTYEASANGDTALLLDSTTAHNSTTRVFNASDGKLANLTDRNAANYGYSYDSNRRVTQRVTPDPSSGALPSRNSSGTYDPPGPSAGWGLETWSYVSASPTDLRVDTYTNAAGETTKYTYDPNSLLPASVTVGSGDDKVTTTYGISNNRVDWTQDGDGVRTCTDYDAVSGLVTATRVNCQPGSTGEATTSYSYNDLGQLDTRVDPAQQGTGTPGHPETRMHWKYEYYGDGSLKSITDPTDTTGATTTTYEYLPTGEESKVTAPGPAAGTGMVTTTSSVARNQPLALCGSAGAGCRIDTTVTPYDGTTTFPGKKIYDRSGDLREDWAPGATAPTTYLYGPMGRLDTVTDPTGVVTRYVYDANGNVTGTNAGTTIGNDTTTATDYDKAGRAWQTTSAANAATGNRTVRQVTFDKVGRVRTETTASGSADQIVKNTDYNTAGKVSQTVLKRTDYPASVTGSPVDAFTKYSYTPGGRVSCVQQRVVAASLGVAEQSTFTLTDYTNGNPTAVHTSVAGVRSVPPTPPPPPSTTTTSTGTTTTTTAPPTTWGCSQYGDTSGPGTWNTEARAYNAAGQLVWSQNPEQHLERPNPAATDHVNYRTSYTYDVLGRAWKVDTPDPANAGTGTVSTRTCFNRRGETTATIAADNTVTLTSYYDAPGLARTVVDPTGTVYNAANNGCASGVGSNTKKGATTYTYDGRGNRLTRQVWLDNNSADPNTWVSATETWTYDAANRLTSYTNGADAPVTIAYTQSGGRITNKATTTGSGTDTRTTTEWYLPSGAIDHVDDTQGATTRTVTDTYDAVGRVKTQTVAGSPASTLTYTYNQAGNVIQVDYPAMGGQAAKTAKTWWALSGIATHVTLPNGSWWRLDHDQAGRLTGTDLAYLAWVPVGAYTLDGNGQPLIETLNSGAGGMTRTTTRRPATGQAFQVNQVVDNKTCTWALTNDSAGRINTITQTSATNQTCDQPGQTTTYGYDAASQLTSAANTGTVPDGRPKSWTYTYGNTGNRLTETAVRKGTGGGADTTTTTTSRYNAGRLCATGPTLPTNCSAASGVTTYGYDTAGRRTTLTRPAGQVSMTYAYDPGGRLATTTATPISGGTDTVTRSYDPAGSLATLTHTNGATTDTIVDWWDHTGFTPVPQITVTATNATGLQLSYGYERITSTGNWFAYDPLGSVLPTSTYTVAPNQYDPYGTPANQNPYSALQYFGYRGEITYADTIHLRARDYDPRTGTFTTRDPLVGVSGTTTVSNPYHYGNNDPVDQVDPTGLRPGDCQSADDHSACTARVTWTKIVRDVVQSRPLIGVLGRCLGADLRIPAVALHGSVCIAADHDQVGYVESASASYLGSLGADAGVSETVFASNARDVWELSGTAVCASVSASAVVLPGLALSGTVCAGIRSNYDLFPGDQVSNRSNPQVPKPGSDKYPPGSAAASATVPKYDCRSLNDSAPDNACEFWLNKLLNEKAFNGVWVANYGPAYSLGLPLGFDIGVGNAWVQSPPHMSYAFLRSLVGL